MLQAVRVHEKAKDPLG